MRKPFSDNYILTQGFGENPQNYSQFGLQGHNGLDYALPTGTKVLAPHAGKIIEAALDPAGYGLYLKIENDKEGSVLAHLKEFRAGVGDIFLEGELLGYSDNSGNSTGAHLHWGYYLFPRNRQNGYAGFIDQESLIVSGVTVAVEASVFENLVRKSTLIDKVAQMLNKEVSEAIIIPDIERLLKMEDAITQKDRQLEEANNKAIELEGEVLEKETELKSLKDQMKTLIDKTQEMSDTIDIAVTENNILSEEIDKLKKDYQPKPVFSGFKKWLYEILIK